MYVQRTLHTRLRGSVWRHRDLRIVGPARALSLLGDEVALIALLLHVYDVGGGPRAVTLLLVAAALPTVLLAPWAGRLADRTDSRALMVGSALLQSAVCVALAFASPLWAIYLLVMLLQAGQAVAGPTWQALIPRIVGEPDVGRAVGATQALMTLAAVAGAPLGGLLVGVGGQRLPLLADAATFAVLAVAGAAVRTRRGGRIAPVAQQDAAVPHACAPHACAPRAAAPRALDGLRVLRADVLLWPIFAALMVYIVVGEATNVVEVFLVREALQGTAMDYGLVGMAAAAGVVAGSLLAGRARAAARLVVVAVAAATVQAGSLLMAGLVPSVAWLLAVYALLGVSNGGLNTSMSTLVLTRTADAVRGQVLAALNGLSRGFSLAALALGGWAGSVLGPRGTFVASGAACLVVAAWLGVRVLPRRAASQAGHRSQRLP